LGFSFVQLSKNRVHYRTSIKNPQALADDLLLLFWRLTGLFRFLAPVIFRKGTYLAAVNWGMPVKGDQRQA